MVTTQAPPEAELHLKTVIREGGTWPPDVLEIMVIFSDGCILRLAVFY
jgi:hypothetical protein